MRQPKNTGIDHVFLARDTGESSDDRVTLDPATIVVLQQDRSSGWLHWKLTAPDDTTQTGVEPVPSHGVVELTASRGGDADDLSRGNYQYELWWQSDTVLPDALPTSQSFEFTLDAVPVGIWRAEVLNEVWLGDDGASTSGNDGGLTGDGGDFLGNSSGGGPGSDASGNIGSGGHVDDGRMDDSLTSSRADSIRLIGTLYHPSDFAMDLSQPVELQFDVDGDGKGDFAQLIDQDAFTIDLETHASRQTISLRAGQYDPTSDRFVFGPWSPYSIGSLRGPRTSDWVEVSLVNDTGMVVDDWVTSDPTLIGIIDASKLSDEQRKKIPDGDVTIQWDWQRDGIADETSGVLDDGTFTVVAKASIPGFVNGSFRPVVSDFDTGELRFSGDWSPIIVRVVEDSAAALSDVRLVWDDGPESNDQQTTIDYVTGRVVNYRPGLEVVFDINGDEIIDGRITPIPNGGFVKRLGLNEGEYQITFGLIHTSDINASSDPVTWETHLNIDVRHDETTPPATSDGGSPTGDGSDVNRDDSGSGGLGVDSGTDGFGLGGIETGGGDGSSVSISDGLQLPESVPDGLHWGQLVQPDDATDEINPPPPVELPDYGFLAGSIPVDDQWELAKRIATAVRENAMAASERTYHQRLAELRHANEVRTLERLRRVDPESNPFDLELDWKERDDLIHRVFMPLLADLNFRIRQLQLDNPFVRLPASRREVDLWIEEDREDTLNLWRTYHSETVPKLFLLERRHASISRQLDQRLLESKRSYVDRYFVPPKYTNYATDTGTPEALSEYERYLREDAIHRDYLTAIRTAEYDARLRHADTHSSVIATYLRADAAAWLQYQSDRSEADAVLDQVRRDSEYQRRLQQFEDSDAFNTQRRTTMSTDGGRISGEADGVIENLRIQQQERLDVSVARHRFELRRNLQSSPHHPGFLSRGADVSGDFHELVEPVLRQRRSDMRQIGLESASVRTLSQRELDRDADYQRRTHAAEIKHESELRVIEAQYADRRMQLQSGVIGQLATQYQTAIGLWHQSRRTDWTAHHVAIAAAHHAYAERWIAAMRTHHNATRTLWADMHQNLNAATRAYQNDVHAVEQTALQSKQSALTDYLRRDNELRDASDHSDPSTAENSYDWARNIVDNVAGLSDWRHKIDPNYGSSYQSSSLSTVLGLSEKLELFFETGGLTPHRFTPENHAAAVEANLEAISRNARWHHDRVATIDRFIQRYFDAEQSRIDAITHTEHRRQIRSHEIWSEHHASVDVARQALDHSMRIAAEILDGETRIAQADYSVNFRRRISADLQSRLAATGLADDRFRAEIAAASHAGAVTTRDAISDQIQTRLDGLRDWSVDMLDARREHARQLDTFNHNYLNKIAGADRDATIDAAKFDSDVRIATLDNHFQSLLWWVDTEQALETTLVDTRIEQHQIHSSSVAQAMAAVDANPKTRTTH